MIPALRSALKTLQLSDKQIAVLSALLEAGVPLYASAVAQGAGLNRTSTYDLLEELATLGLVSTIEKGGARRYQAIAADLLPAYVERRVAELEEAKRRVMDALPQIKLFQSRGKSLPKVQFFEGIAGVKQAYEDTLDNNKGKELWDLTGTDAVYQKMGAEWVDYYLKKRTRLGIRATVIAPDTEWSALAKSEDEKWLRTMKLIPRELTFDSEIDIYDNKVGIFSFSQEHPVAVLIEDDTINRTMKTLFDFMALHAR